MKATPVFKTVALKPLGVAGCIIGRAIYEGKLNLREVLKIAQSNQLL